MLKFTYVSLEQSEIFFVLSQFHKSLGIKCSALKTLSFLCPAKCSVKVTCNSPQKSLKSQHTTSINFRVKIWKPKLFSSIQTNNFFFRIFFRQIKTLSCARFYFTTLLFNALRTTILARWTRLTQKLSSFGLKHYQIIFGNILCDGWFYFMAKKKMKTFFVMQSAARV